MGLFNFDDGTAKPSYRKTNIAKEKKNKLEFP